MVIVLEILLIAAICVIFLLCKTIIFIVDPNAAIKKWYNKNVVEEFPCTLLWTFENDWDFEGSSCDFSLYKDYNVIGLTEYYKDKGLLEEKYYMENNEPTLLCIPDQKIVLLKDGRYEWDLRQYL